MTNQTFTNEATALLPEVNRARFSEITNTDVQNSNISLPSLQNFTLKIDKSLPILQDVIQKYIEFAVQCNGGAKDRTAREIGIDRKTLYKKIKMAAEQLKKSHSPA
jgi:DNA-binding NtrC family response regulator